LFCAALLTIVTSVFVQQVHTQPVQMQQVHMQPVQMQQVRMGPHVNGVLRGSDDDSDFCVCAAGSHAARADAAGSHAARADAAG
jgi:hypothetical protein